MICDSKASILLPSAPVGAWTLDNSVTSEIELFAGTTTLISISEYEAVSFRLPATSINGSSQAMVLNSAYSSLLELSYDNYESNLKTIYTYKVKKNISNDASSSNKNVFNIYISGIDTYGSISTVSRSDVILSWQLIWILIRF